MWMKTPWSERHPLRAQNRTQRAPCLRTQPLSLLCTSPKHDISKKKHAFPWNSNQDFFFFFSIAHEPQKPEKHRSGDPQAARTRLWAETKGQVRPQLCTLFGKTWLQLTHPWLQKKLFALGLLSQREPALPASMFGSYLFLQTVQAMAGEQSSRRGCQQRVQLKAFRSLGAEHLNFILVQNPVQLAITMPAWLRRATVLPGFLML